MATPADIAPRVQERTKHSRQCCPFRCIPLANSRRKSPQPDACAGTKTARQRSRVRRPRAWAAMAGPISEFVTPRSPLFCRRMTPTPEIRLWFPSPLRAKSARVLISRDTSELRSPESARTDHRCTPGLGIGHRMGGPLPGDHRGNGSSSPPRRASDIPTQLPRDQDLEMRGSRLAVVENVLGSL